jgi:hypothetical protein
MIHRRERKLNTLLNHIQEKEVQNLIMESNSKAVLFAYNCMKYKEYIAVSTMFHTISRGYQR